MTLRNTQKTPETAWNASARHPLQTWQWGEFRAAMGIRTERITWQGSQPGQGQITFHPIPHTPWTIGYFPKGPKPTREMIGALNRLGRECRAVYIQLEPDISAREQFQPSQFPSLVSSHHPLFTKYTFILDITKSEDELLKAMHSKTRYNLRVAQKHGVIVREDNSDDAFNAYLALTRETTGRQGFYAHNETYHRTMWKIMKSAGIAHLFTAAYRGKTLAAWIIFSWNNTLYYPYGASSRDHREVMAPTLLLWEIVRWGKAHGCATFDLWGALGPDTSGQPDPNDPWFGFHRFKQGFTPTLVESAGSFDLVIHPLLYRIYTIADAVRWFFLKRIAHG